MISKVISLCTILLLFIGFNSSAGHTDQTGQEISTVQFDGIDRNLYFKTTNGAWTTEGCNPRYVWVKPNIEGQKEILSIGLAAKMSGKKVWFYGTCATGASDYFEATYIVIM